MTARASKLVPMAATIPARETGLGEPTAVTSGVHRRAGVKVGWTSRAWTCAEWVIGHDAFVTVLEFREPRGTYYQADIECGKFRSLGVGATAFDALKEAFSGEFFRDEDWFRHQVAQAVPLPEWAIEPWQRLKRDRRRRNGRA